MAAQETRLRKRQQITQANKTMFLWVAAASAIVGIALVVSILLFQKAIFNEHVLGDKNATANTLKNNIANVAKLKDQIRVRNTSQALMSSMAPGEDQPIRVVLDALPSDANSSALGSSLQQKFLNDPALRIESFNVDPIAGAESQSATDVQDASSSTTAPETNTITFRFAVSADNSNLNALKTLMQNMERSIRAIDVTSLIIETQSNRTVLTVSGQAYYEPAVTVQLKEKTEKP